MIYFLYYATGQHEDYRRVELFYGTEDFCKQKLKDAWDLYRYLEKRFNKLNKTGGFDYDDVMSRYFKALGYKIYIDGDIIFGIYCMESFDEFSKKINNIDKLYEKREIESRNKST